MATSDERSNAEQQGGTPPTSPPSSTSASPPTSTTTLNKASPLIYQQHQSFCIDALLRPSSPASSPPLHDGASPPSSPASSPFGPGRPSLMPPSALFPNNPAIGGILYPYPGSLLNVSSAASPTTSSASVTSSLESVLKNGMNMQTVQLEWLARTGMLYHRFPELAGNLSSSLHRHLYLHSCNSTKYRMIIFSFVGIFVVIYLTSVHRHGGLIPHHPHA
jgi:hypothetical protein